jgi:hypothetical protein
MAQSELKQKESIPEENPGAGISKPFQTSLAVKKHKMNWTNEGIGWRRKNYFILKPETNIDPWRVRWVAGQPGEQIMEKEDSFVFEDQAFDHANKIIREEAKKKKIARRRICCRNIRKRL